MTIIVLQGRSRCPRRNSIGSVLMRIRFRIIDWTSTLSSYTREEWEAGWYLLLKLTHNYSPMSPAHMDWTPHYPAFVDPNQSNVNLSGARKLLKDVEVVDIGCGYGGLLVGLAPLLPETLMVGKLPSFQKDNIQRESQGLIDNRQVWKLEPKSSITSEPASMPYDTSRASSKATLNRHQKHQHNSPQLRVLRKHKQTQTHPLPKASQQPLSPATMRTYPHSAVIP